MDPCGPPTASSQGSPSPWLLHGIPPKVTAGLLPLGEYDILMKQIDN